MIRIDARAAKVGAAAFYADIAPQAGAAAADVLIVFVPGDHRDTAWRRAAVQDLARAAAPRRINAVAAPSEAAIAAAETYLAAASGVTGQYLALDDSGAGTVLS